jgi:hypothetical protein
VFDRLLITAGVAGFLVALSALIHYEVLRLCNDHFPKLDWVAGRARVLVVIAAAFCSHLAQIALFAAAYGFLHDTAMGSLRGQIGSLTMSLLYFSAETYTSLGFGDLYPVGEMRLIAGLEALTGLLMIGWTASFTYLEMSRRWMVRER